MPSSHNGFKTKTCFRLCLRIPCIVSSPILFKFYTFAITRHRKSVCTSRLNGFIFFIRLSAAASRRSAIIEGAHLSLFYLLQRMWSRSSARPPSTSTSPSTGTASSYGCTSARSGTSSSATASSPSFSWWVWSQLTCYGNTHGHSPLCLVLRYLSLSVCLSVFNSITSSHIQQISISLLMYFQLIHFTPCL